MSSKTETFTVKYDGGGSEQWRERIDCSGQPSTVLVDARGVVVLNTPSEVVRYVERTGTTFCTAKLNSCGTLPAISASGTPSATATSGFLIASSNVRTNKLGLVIYTDNGRRTPAQAFGQGGLLCINAPIARAPILPSSGGTTGDCDATLSLDMNCFAAGMCAGNPQAYLSIPGTLVDCQWWGRDTLAHGAYLSDALEYSVGP